MNCIINEITSQSAPHQHKEYEIIVYTRGEGVSYGTESHPVKQGSIAIIPPDTIHACAVPQWLERIYIRGEFSHCFSFDRPVYLTDNPQQEGTLLAKLIYQNRYANPEYLSALIDAFLHFLMQSIHTQDRVHMAISHIIDQITGSFYDYAVDVRAMLEDSGYAEDYIRAQFKKTTGKTPVEFLTEVRIRHACCLIDTYGRDMPLADIACKCGYTDYVYFSKKFKAITGVSPRTYMANTFAL